jgi:DNA polymerase-3 subunit delta
LPTLSPAKLYKRLESRPSSAAFFLHGEEELLREEAVQRVVAAYLDPATRDFNHDQLRGPEAGAELIASIAATPPMMAEYRVLVVREVQGLVPKAREVVQAIAAAPPPGLILVLTGQIPRESRAKFYEALKASAASVEFGAVQPHDLPGLLMERAAEEHGLELEPDAARGLVAALGDQLGVLTSELAKLASFVGDRGRITREDVRSLTGYLPRVDRWEWFDLVAERRFDEALRLLPDLLETGESGVGLVLGLGGQLVRLGLGVAGGREALERDLPPRQRWLAGRIVAAARRWSVAEVDDAVAELLRADRLLKSASLSDRQVVEELLLRLATRLSARSAA